MLPYIQLPMELQESFEQLSDAELGRLVLAMMNYNRTGEAAQLTGNEKILWPIVRDMLDRAHAVREQRAKAGAKSRKEKTPSKAKPKQTRQKKEDPSAQPPVAPAMTSAESEPLISEEEATANAEALQEVYDAAESVGMPSDARTLDQLTALSAEYTPPWVVQALTACHEANAVNLRYLKGVLRGFRERGGPDEQKKAAPAASNEPAWVVALREQGIEV